MQQLFFARKNSIMISDNPYERIPDRERQMKHLRVTVLLSAMLLCSLFAGFFSPIVVRADDVTDYITDRAGLVQALASDQEVIYVGDIVFDEKDLYIKIDRSVKIVGKPERSVLKYAHFSIEGSEVESEQIDVSFENIRFDGGYSMPAGDPNEAASFDSFHGDRTDKGCLVAKGFLEFSCISCEIENYCAKYGAAMYFHYTAGNVDLGKRAGLDIRDCAFRNNISERGIFWCNGKKTKFSMSQVEFKENTAYSSVVVLGGVDGTADGLSIIGNRRVVFREKNSFPQGGGGVAVANSVLLLKDSVILRNQGPCGGGLLCTNTKLTVDSCDISDNSADTYGGGIVIQSDEKAPVYIVNTSITGNVAKEEGAVYVCPADQINIGVPTGITQFAFCTIRDNRSEDSEHLVFHPVIRECEDTTVGRDGQIDFTACRIRDDKVSDALKDGDNYNIINSDRKGERVPQEVVKKVANGYYADSDTKLYPGVNLPKADEPAKPLLLIMAILLGVAVLCAAVLLSLRHMTHVREDREDINRASDEAVAAVNCDVETSDIGAYMAVYEAGSYDKTEAFLQSRLAGGKLTEREVDVLREYLSGKTRAQIGKTLFISESTVKNHISNIFAKLDVKNRKQLQEVIQNEQTDPNQGGNDEDTEPS